MPDIDGDDGAARAPYIHSFINDGNSNDDQGSIVHATEIVLPRDCALVPCNLEIV